MKYYCVIKSKILTEKQYRNCLKCSKDSFEKVVETQYSTKWTGCATFNIVGGRDTKDFETNMQNLIKFKTREKKLKRIANGTNI